MNKGIVKYSDVGPAVEQDMSSFQKGWAGSGINFGGIGKNIRTSNPFTSSNIQAIGSHIGGGLSSLGNYLTSGKGITSLWSDESKNFTAGMFNSATQGMDVDSLNSYMKKNDLEGYTFAPDGNGGWNLGAKDGSELLNKDAVVGQTGGGMNWGKALGSAQNIANLGVAGWGLYSSIQNYKQDREIKEKQIEYLKESIDQYKKDKQHIAEERARQGRMRSNTTAQRASSSSVKSF